MDEIKILIIEDDAELAAAMAEYLSLQNVQCDFAYNGAAGLELAQANRFDAIVLDLMLPKIGGYEVCEQLRMFGNSTPVLMQTACDTNAEQLAGFQAGVDDYVVKPCTMPLLWARLQALHRRNNPQTEKVTIGDLTIYLKEHRVVRENQEIKLTPTAWRMLELLAQRSPEVVARSELEQHAWPDSDVQAGNFNVQLHQLRKAIDKPFAYPMIDTIVGIGLCLRDKDTTNEN